METKGGAACERALLSAWFEGQRQLTDGGATSAQEITTPRECATMQGASAAAEAAPRRQLAAAPKAPRQNSRSEYEGLLGGQ
jgi:hypothetical protein